MGIGNEYISKNYLEINIYEAAVERLKYIFGNFEKVYFSFSGGKDSSVMVQLAIEIARELNKLPISVLFIDLEAQYKATIDHVSEIMALPEIVPYWICLPIHLRNAVSMYQPQWVCWNPEKRNKWVRELPKGVIDDTAYFPFYNYGMEFEEFVVEFGKWFSGDDLTACGVGIRADESLNRFRTLKNEKKNRYKDKMWTTKIIGNVYNFYPIYDWKVEDIWTCVGQNQFKYNQIYDLMYIQGKSLSEMRICQPYGDDQRKGLNLFRQLEPETWAKIVDRVSGANFGNIYCQSYLLGHRKAILPPGHTWKSYTQFLLDTIPKHEKMWYQDRFEVFIKWWEKHGWNLADFPDATLKEDVKCVKFWNNEEYDSKGPSWERMARCLLKNDKLCKSLGFSQSKHQYDKYQKLRELYGE